MATCRICLRPEQEAGPLAEGICIDCERKLDDLPPASTEVAVARQDRRLDTVSNLGSPDPMQLFQQAISQGFNGDQLAQLLSLQREWKKDQAAEAYAAAITGFQAEMPAITKSRTASIKYKNSESTFSYKYASFDNVMKVARPHLQRWGIALSFDTQTSDAGKRMEVTVNIRVGIHTEQRKFSIPITPGLMSDAQACGAALSYAKRYALCAAMNIVVTDEDNDAEALDHITETERDEVQRIIEKLGKTISYGNFLAWAGVEPADKKVPAWSDLASIPNTEFARIMDELHRREAKFDLDQTKGPKP